jgi:hypothetical protein
VETKKSVSASVLAEHSKTDGTIAEGQHVKQDAEQPQRVAGTPPEWGTFVNAEQVAAFMGWSKETVYQLADVGKLRALCSDGGPYRRRKGKRGRRGVRILASSVAELIMSAADPVRSQPPAQVEPEAASLPRPALGDRHQPTRPRTTGRSKSRVALPYPCQSRSATPGASPSAQTDGSSVV